MADNSPKSEALKTLIKNRLYSLTNYSDLKRIIESNQFTIIEYKKRTNSEFVYELIKKLGIEKEVEQNDSFLFIKNNLKFLFINADVPNEDKCSLLRHELGHICDPDLKNSDINHSKIKKEEFANEFSFYIKNPGISFKLYLLIIKNWKLLVSMVIILACALGLYCKTDIQKTQPIKSVTSNASPSVNSDETYYVTSSGKKYHYKHCYIVKHKTNITEITLSEAINNGYKPCLICNPVEN